MKLSEVMSTNRAFKRRHDLKWKVGNGPWLFDDKDITAEDYELKPRSKPLKPLPLCHDANEIHHIKEKVNEITEYIRRTM